MVDEKGNSLNSFADSSKLPFDVSLEPGETVKTTCDLDLAGPVGKLIVIGKELFS